MKKSVIIILILLSVFITGPLARAQYLELIKTVEGVSDKVVESGDIFTMFYSTAGPAQQKMDRMSLSQMCCHQNCSMTAQLTLLILRM